MNRAVAFLAAALLAATLGVAQNAPTGAAAGSQSSGEQQGQSKAITGCLSSSSLGENHFTITDETSGTVYRLSGLTDQLVSHAGQKVRVTGVDQSNQSSNSSAYDTPNTSASRTSDNSGKSGNSAASGSSTTTGNNSLQVTSVQKLADHCSSTGAAKPQGGAQTEARASAQVKLISYKTVADDEGALAGASEPGNATQADSSAQNGTVDQANANDLPRTATALPLLGILGLGSLVAGFIVRR
jgi:hypothetical protein